MCGLGCCRHRPLDRPRSVGLLWALDGGRLVELHRDWTLLSSPKPGRGAFLTAEALEEMSSFPGSKPETSQGGGQLRARGRVGRGSR
jgi:hypothetical protein